MDGAEKLKAHLLSAIRAQEKDTPETRAAIYGKVHELMTFSKLAHMTRDLDTAIAEIEAGYAAQAPAPAALAPEAESRGASLAAPAASARAWFSGWRRAAAIAAGCILLSVAVTWFLSGPADDPDFDKGFAAYSGSAVGFEDIPPWSTYYQAGTADGVTFVEVAGPAPLYSKQVFPVRPDKAYRVSTRIRVTADDPGRKGAVNSAGVVAYDANGNTIGQYFNTAHYGAMNGRLMTVAEGWVESEGIMRWDSKDDPQLLPAGTVSVRLVVLFNSESPKAVSQVDYLRFQEVQAP